MKNATHTIGDTEQDAFVTATEGISGKSIASESVTPPQAYQKAYHMTGG